MLDSKQFVALLKMIDTFERIKRESYTEPVADLPEVTHVSDLPEEATVVLMKQLLLELGHVIKEAPTPDVDGDGPPEKADKMDSKYIPNMCEQASLSLVKKLSSPAGKSPLFKLGRQKSQRLGKIVQSIEF